MFPLFLWPLFPCYFLGYPESGNLTPPPPPPRVFHHWICSRVLGPNQNRRVNRNLPLCNPLLVNWDSRSSRSSPRLLDAFRPARRRTTDNIVSLRKRVIYPAPTFEGPGPLLTFIAMVYRKKMRRRKKRKTPLLPRDTRKQISSKIAQLSNLLEKYWTWVSETLGFPFGFPFNHKGVVGGPLLGFPKAKNRTGLLLGFLSL